MKQFLKRELFWYMGLYALTMLIVALEFVFNPNENLEQFVVFGALYAVRSTILAFVHVFGVVLSLIVGHPKTLMMFKKLAFYAFAPFIVLFIDVILHL